jgi:hypothetical protein
MPKKADFGILNFDTGIIGVLIRSQKSMDRPISTINPQINIIESRMFSITNTNLYN